MKGSVAERTKRMAKVHFISGLPRSGSTLLAGILRQNPRIHAAMSSPVGGLIHGALEHMGSGAEGATFFDTDRRRAISRAIFDAYYARLDHSLIFDTNRHWTARLHQLVEMFDDFKVVCCVRNPAWIMDSFEVIYRKNPFDYSRMFTPVTRQTIYTRCEALAHVAGPMGSAWAALKEAYYGPYSDRLLLLDYDLLVQKPEQAMRLIYEFIGEAPFVHDFGNVVYEESEFDMQLGVKGLHTVGREVVYRPRRTLLPPDLFKKYDEMDFWRDPAGTAATRITPKPAAAGVRS